MPVKKTDWQTDRSALQMVRRRVFIDEQHISESEEWDSADINAVHFIYQRGTHTVGCVRVVGGKIGRMAVLLEYRQQNIGSELLRAAETFLAENNHKRSELDAQAQAFFFYQKAGYITDDEYLWDAGIAHVKMNKMLGKNMPTPKQLQLSVDKHTHRLSTEAMRFETSAEKSAHLSAAITSWLEIACMQSKKKIILYLKNINHPALKSQDFLSGLIAYLKGSKSREIIIIEDDAKALLRNTQHPLNRYIKNTSGRIQLRQAINQEGKPQKSYMIFDSVAHIAFDHIDGEYSPSSDVQFLYQLVKKINE